MFDREDLSNDRPTTGIETRGRLCAEIAGVGTALGPESYSQRDILDMFRVEDRRIRAMFLNGGIERRHLELPPADVAGIRQIESQSALLDKHVNIGRRLGRGAIEACLEATGATAKDIGYLCCVSSTGFIIPGFSAMLIRDMGLLTSCSRLDVVGMGCNAGLNALTAVAGWASTHPDQLAVMVCIEVCSALYLFDQTLETAVVNSLFGDGAAAIAVIAPSDGSQAGPRLLRFSSCIVPDAIDAMRIDWNEQHGRFSFGLAPDVPYVVGANVEGSLERLLKGTGVRKSDIAHWLVHSGGRKVVDAVRVNLGLTREDVRHTLGVLREHGNLSSASFLFSYERLCLEAIIKQSEYGVMMTMGPGSTIEMALLQW